MFTPMSESGETYSESIDSYLEPITFCCPLLDAACDQSQRAGLHCCGQDGIQLLLLTDECTH